MRQMVSGPEGQEQFEVEKLRRMRNETFGTRYLAKERDLAAVVNLNLLYELQLSMREISAFKTPCLSLTRATDGDASGVALYVCV